MPKVGRRAPKKSAGAARNSAGAAKKSGGAAKKSGGAAEKSVGAAKKSGRAAEKSAGAAKKRAGAAALPKNGAAEAAQEPATPGPVRVTPGTTAGTAGTALKINPGSPWSKYSCRGRCYFYNWDTTVFSLRQPGEGVKGERQEEEQKFEKDMITARRMDGGELNAQSEWERVVCGGRAYYFHEVSERFSLERPEEGFRLETVERAADFDKDYAKAEQMDSARHRLGRKRQRDGDAGSDSDSDSDDSIALSSDSDDDGDDDKPTKQKAAAAAAGVPQPKGRPRPGHTWNRQLGCWEKDHDDSDDAPEETAVSGVMDSSDEESWYVTEVVGKRWVSGRGGGLQYLVRWRGYEKRTWEPARQLDGCRELVDDFESRQPAAPKRRREEQEQEREQEHQPPAKPVVRWRCFLRFDRSIAHGLSQQASPLQACACCMMVPDDDDRQTTPCGHHFCTE